MKQPRRHTTLLFITLGIIAVVLLLIDMATGDTYIPIPKVWAVLTGGECDEMTRNILLSIRFIRVVVAGLIGIALSVSGLQMQTVFQNPLADPYLLGDWESAVVRPDVVLRDLIHIFHPELVSDSTYYYRHLE